MLPSMPMRALRAALLLLPLAWAAPAAAQVDPEARQRCFDAKADADLKIGACTSLIRSGQYDNDGLSRVYTVRGLAYQNSGHAQEAVNDYTQAISLNPSLTQAVINRATVYERVGQFGDALADYTRATELDGNSADAWMGMCYAHFRLGQTQASLSDCNRSLRLRPGHFVTLLDRGLIHLRMRNWNLAMADYDAALGLASDSSWAHYGRGLALNGLGRTTQGRAEIEAAKQLDAGIGGKHRPFDLNMPLP